MGRKTIKKTYSDTYARGERSKIKGNRYWVNVSLTSIKAEEGFSEKFGLDKEGEFYFKAGPGLKKFRSPQRGEIHLGVNQVFTVPKSTDFTIYQAFEDFDDDKGLIKVPFQVFEANLGRDNKLIDARLEIKPGQSSDYLVFRENNVRVKIQISANQTRY